jgi:hypothetical protein
MSAPRVLPDTSAEVPASLTSQQPRKLTALDRNNMEWDSHKEEIRSMYFHQRKTLQETMQWFQQERGLKWR